MSRLLLSLLGVAQVLLGTRVLGGAAQGRLDTEPEQTSTDYVVDSEVTQATDSVLPSIVQVGFEATLVTLLSVPPFNTTGGGYHLPLDSPYLEELVDALRRALEDGQLVRMSWGLRCIHS